MARDFQRWKDLPALRPSSPICSEHLSLHSDDDGDIEL